MRGMSWQRRPELLFHFYPVGDADHLRFIEDALVGGCWALILDGFRTGLEVGLSAPPTRARRLRDSDRPLACLQSVQVARLNFALRQEYGGASSALFRKNR